MSLSLRLGLVLCASPTAAVVMPASFQMEAEWIMNPVPQLFTELARKARRLDLHSTAPHKIRSFQPGEDVLVMQYPDRLEELAVKHAVGAGKGWETTEAMELCNIYRKEDFGNILEVGAKEGAYTLPLATCLKDRGLVLAVEGMPETADHLRAGIVADNATNVQLYPYAVTKPTVANEATVEAEGRLAHEVKVPLTTGDAMLQSNAAMKALMMAKIETEGDVGHFFQGSQKLFVEHPPCYLTVEFLSKDLTESGTPIGQILTQLKAWGYRKTGRWSVPTLKDVEKRHLKTWTIAYGENSQAHDQCVQRVKKSLHM